MLKLENSIRGLSFSRVAFDLTIQDAKKPHHAVMYRVLILQEQVGVLLILQLSREGVTFRREFWTPEENVLAQNCDITRTWQGYLIHK